MRVTSTSARLRTQFWRLKVRRVSLRLRSARLAQASHRCIWCSAQLPSVEKRKLRCPDCLEFLRCSFARRQLCPHCTTRRKAAPRRPSSTPGSPGALRSLRMSVAVSPSALRSAAMSPCPRCAARRKDSSCVHVLQSRSLGILVDNGVRVRGGSDERGQARQAVASLADRSGPAPVGTDPRLEKFCPPILLLFNK